MSNKDDGFNLDDLMNSSTDEEENSSKKKKDEENEKNEDDNQYKSKSDRAKERNNKKKKSQNADFELATQSTRDKKKNQFSVWAFFKKHIMKYLIGLIVGVIVGIMLFGGSSSQEENRQVYEVDQGVSLEDQINNVHSSQNDAIRQQFSALRGDSANDSMSEEQDKIAGVNENLAKSIDPFLKEVMNTPMNPSKKEIDKRTNKLKDLSTSDNDEKDYDEAAIKNLLEGNSALKELNEPGVKSGSTFATLMGVDKKKNDVYLTMTPYTTKHKTVNVLYLIKANNDGKFVSGTYVGYIQSSDKNRAKDTYGYLGNILKGDVNADQINKAISNEIEQKQKEEQDQKEQAQKEDKKDDNKQAKDKNKKDDKQDDKKQDNKKDKKDDSKKDDKK